MPRKPSVRYWKSRKGYCVKVGGVQHLLASGPEDAPAGPCYLAALDEFKKLMEFGQLDQAGDSNTVRAVLDGYLQAIEGKVTPNTFRLRLMSCKIFAERWGDKRCSEIKPFHAEEIIAERRRLEKPRRWGDGTAGIFAVSLKAAFNWAVKRELIARNPLASLESLKARSRGRESVITEEEHVRVLNALASPRLAYLKRLVIGLENTGARPGEIRNARAGDFDPVRGCLVYYRDSARREGEFRHKTGAKRDRLIYFTGQALEMVRDLVAAKKPGELLFPGRDGQVISPSRLHRSFWRLKQRSGVKALCPYAYRHTFATRWLAKGGSIELLAQLLGNSPGTIRLHYSHLCGEHEALRAALERFRGT
jgi:integrase